MDYLNPKNIKYLCVHCSASRWGDKEAINTWHKERGFAMIGYHEVILNGYRTSAMRYDSKIDGLVEFGRPSTVVGAHCAAGGLNYKSLGFCLIGIPGFDKYPTPLQYDALVTRLARRCIQYNLNPIFAITQHSVWEKSKPLCASVKLLILKARVALKVKELKKNKVSIVVK